MTADVGTFEVLWFALMVSLVLLAVLAFSAAMTVVLPWLQRELGWRRMRGSR